MRVILVVYSLKVHSEEVFLKAVQGVKAGDIVSRDDLLCVVTNACNTFDSKQAQTLARQIKEVSQNAGRPGE
jgi:hypothetical protein